MPTLNPVQMAVSDVYEVLSLLLKGQDSGGIQSLMFTTSSQATSGMELDDRIGELSDLSTFMRMIYTYPLSICLMSQAKRVPVQSSII